MCSSRKHFTPSVAAAFSGVSYEGAKFGPVQSGLDHETPDLLSKVL